MPQICNVVRRAWAMQFINHLPATACSGVWPIALQGSAQGSVSNACVSAMCVTDDLINRNFTGCSEHV